MPALLVEDVPSGGYFFFCGFLLVNVYLIYCFCVISMCVYLLAGAYMCVLLPNETQFICCAHSLYLYLWKSNTVLFHRMGEKLFFFLQYEHLFVF